MNIKSFGLTDIGSSRKNNEDVWVAHPEIGFFAIADGMGGHNAGEIAAKEATEHLAAAIKKFPESDPIELAIELRSLIEKTNHWVYKLGKKNKDYRGMGTTLCCLIWFENAVVYAHVGDSRIYRFREGKLKLLTEDHSLYAKWEKTGKRSSTPYPYKNIITRAIGTSSKANPEIALSTYQPGDLFLLCTDGLSDALSLTDIENILLSAKNLESASHELIETAKIKGSSDNITLLLTQNETQGAKNLLRQQRHNPARSPGS